MTVLSREGIKLALDARRILIDPYTESNLGPNSYDVTLGGQYARVVAPALRPEVDRTSIHSDAFHPSVVAATAEWINPFSKKHFDDMWEIFQAPTVAELKASGFDREDFSGLKEGDQVIIIHPQETILGYTQEFIGGTCDNITTLMKARSSLARHFISVCVDSGWGDVGYHNRWAMRITNANVNQRFLLKVGMRVAQIAFIEVSHPVAEVYGGKYQPTSTGIKELKESWDVLDILPRMWKDYEVDSNE